MTNNDDVHCTEIRTQTIDYYSYRVLRCDDIFIHSSLLLHCPLDMLKQKIKKRVNQMYTLSQQIK